jgi:hypothetical protein
MTGTKAISKVALLYSILSIATLIYNNRQTALRTPPHPCGTDLLEPSCCILSCSTGLAGTLQLGLGVSLEQASDCSILAWLFGRDWTAATWRKTSLTVWDGNDGKADLLCAPPPGTGGWALAGRAWAGF